MSAEEGVLVGSGELLVDLGEVARKCGGSVVVDGKEVVVPPRQCVVEFMDGAVMKLDAHMTRMEPHGFVAIDGEAEWDHSNTTVYPWHTIRVVVRGFARPIEKSKDVGR